MVTASWCGMNVSLIDGGTRDFIRRSRRILSLDERSLDPVGPETRSGWLRIVRLHVPARPCPGLELPGFSDYGGDDLDRVLHVEK